MELINSIIQNPLSLTELSRKGYSNNVLKYQSKQKIIYYVPSYLRMKIKNIISLDFQTLEGQINVTILFSVYYSTMDKELVQFMIDNTRLVFQSSQILKLDKEDNATTFKHDQKKKLFTFSVRKILTVRLQSQPFWSPFQNVRYIISINLRSLKTEFNDKKCKIMYNLMDNQNMDNKFFLGTSCSFGTYRIAQKLLYVQYTNSYVYSKSKNAGKHQTIRQKIIKTFKQHIIKRFFSSSKQQNIKVMKQFEQQCKLIQNINTVKNYQHAHFILTLYKKPIPSIFTIYFPLILLGIINIGIFYQSMKATGKKMANTAALLVSFIQLVGTVRQMTAMGPTVSFTQILVFLQGFTTVLTIIHMIKYRNQPNFKQNLAQDGLAIACVVITSFVVFMTIILIIFYKLIWKKSYHYDKQQLILKKQNDDSFKHQKWYNQKCDAYFYFIKQDLQQIKELKEQQSLQIILKTKKIKLKTEEEGKQIKQMKKQNKQFQQ